MAHLVQSPLSAGFVLPVTVCMVITVTRELYLQGWAQSMAWRIPSLKVWGDWRRSQLHGHTAQVGWPTMPTLRRTWCFHIMLCYGYLEVLNNFCTGFLKLWSWTWVRKGGSVGNEGMSNLGRWEIDREATRNYAVPKFSSLRWKVESEVITSTAINVLSPYLVAH